MSIVIEQTWPLPEVDTVFEFVFAMELGAAPDGHKVAVTCRWPPVETRFVTLHAVRPTPVCLHFQSGYELRGKMEVIHDGDRRTPSIGVYADLAYDWRGQPPVRHFQGLIFLREEPIPPPHPPLPPPCPPLPPPDGDEPAPLPIVTPHDELFPYVYVRQWPKIPDEDLEYGFFSYEAASPPAGAFIADLAAAVPLGRAAMEALALDFIDGAPPWQGQYIATRSAIPDPVAGFAPLALLLPRGEPWREEWVEQLRRDMLALLGRHGETGLYLQSADYAAILDQVWQSYFALTVLLGYDQALLADLGLTLWLADAARKGLIVEPDGGLAIAGLTADQRALLASASPLLPENVFPLPPAIQASPPAPAGGGWVEPYAVGDLQMVHQRLVRYAAGEIARIENVMRGERREISSRHGRQQLDVNPKQGSEEQLLETEDSDERSCQLEQMSREIAGETVSDTYSDFQTSYGPPTQVTLNGTKSRATSADQPGSDDAARFAREILGKTVNRIARTVGTLRATSSLSQVEDAVTSVIDNSRGETNLCAVYRWVNKVYEACVVNYGNRLIMEFVLRRPAAGFIARRDLGPDRRGDAPIPLPDMGIASFEDVTPKNYPGLCAAYGVTDIAPPPPAARIVSAVLRAGEETQIAIPAGYAAVAARAACASAPPPAILVGCQNVTPGEDASLTPAGEEATLPVSVADVPSSLSPPACSDVLVNVEVDCARTPRCLDEWQIQIYAALVKACEEKAERRLAAVADNGLAPSLLSPLACRDIERRALRQGCERLLLERAALLTGGPAASPPAPAPADVDEPRYQQFLDEALEWPEMTYSFRPGDPAEADAGEQSGGDTLFAGFLGAARARVLVPVRPERALAFLYFYASGTIWDGPDRLVAVNAGDVHIADDLKRLARRPEPERRVGAPWEIVVPTAMQILDGLDRPALGLGPAAAIAADAP